MSSPDCPRLGDLDGGDHASPLRSYTRQTKTRAAPRAHDDIESPIRSPGLFSLRGWAPCARLIDGPLRSHRLHRQGILPHGICRRIRASPPWRSSTIMSLFEGPRGDSPSRMLRSMKRAGGGRLSSALANNVAPPPPWVASVSVLRVSSHFTPVGKTLLLPGPRKPLCFTCGNGLLPVLLGSALASPTT